MAFAPRSIDGQLRSAAEQRIDFLTGTTQIESPEEAANYREIHDQASRFGGVNLHAITLPRISPEALLLFNDQQQTDLRRFMAKVVLETGPYGQHVTYAQRQQFAADTFALKSAGMRGMVAANSKAGALTVAAMVQDPKMSEHTADTLSILGSEWNGSWQSADLAAVSYNGAAVRSLRRIFGDTPTLRGLQTHKDIGDVVERVVSVATGDPGDSSELPGLATTLLSAKESGWLVEAEDSSGLSRAALLGVAAEFYGGRMQLRGTQNWVELYGLHNNLRVLTSLESTSQNKQPQLALALAG